MNRINWVAMVVALVAIAAHFLHGSGATPTAGISAADRGVHHSVGAPAAPRAADAPAEDTGDSTGTLILHVAVACVALLGTTTLTARRRLVKAISNAYARRTLGPLLSMFARTPRPAWARSASEQLALLSVLQR